MLLHYNQIQEQALIEVIQQELTLFPALAWQDIYKLLFQSLFGPGHMISDRDAARNFLQIELQDLGENVFPIIEKISIIKPFARLNICTVRDGLITEEELLSILIQSCEPVTEEDISLFLHNWSRLCSYLIEKIPALYHIKGYDELCSSISVTHPLVHHSELFRRLYQPHYRVIKLELLSPAMRSFLA